MISLVMYFLILHFYIFNFVVAHLNINKWLSTITKNIYKCNFYYTSKMKEVVLYIFLNDWLCTIYCILIFISKDDAYVNECTFIAARFIFRSRTTKECPVILVMSTMHYLTLANFQVVRLSSESYKRIIKSLQLKCLPPAFIMRMNYIPYIFRMQYFWSDSVKHIHCIKFSSIHLYRNQFK